MLGDVLPNFDVTCKGLAVILDETLQAFVGGPMSSVLKSKPAELVVHARIEVSNKEMGPELVEDVHVVRAVATRSGITSIRSYPEQIAVKNNVGVSRKRLRRVLLVLDPVKSHRRSFRW